MPHEILSLAEKNQKKAFDIIHELQIVEVWKSFGAKANLIGSLKTGLLLKNLDIDFHIYSDNFSIKNSFGAITKIAENPKIKKVTYDNLLDTEEMCIEWHAWYQDDKKRLWQIDMIHILNESPYAGKMEKVAERINAILTPELKHNILTIKNEVPEGGKVIGIEVYKAAIQDGVKNYQEFLLWKEKQEPHYIIDWIP